MNLIQNPAAVPIQNYKICGGTFLFSNSGYKKDTMRIVVAQSATTIQQTDSLFLEDFPKFRITRIYPYLSISISSLV